MVRRTAGVVEMYLTDEALEADIDKGESPCCASGCGGPHCACSHRAGERLSIEMIESRHDHSEEDNRRLLDIIVEMDRQIKAVKKIRR